MWKDMLKPKRFCSTKTEKEKKKEIDSSRKRINRNLVMREREGRLGEGIERTRRKLGEAAGRQGRVLVFWSLQRRLVRNNNNILSSTVGWKTKEMEFCISRLTLPKFLLHAPNTNKACWCEWFRRMLRRLHSTFRRAAAEYRCGSETREGSTVLWQQKLRARNHLEKVSVAGRKIFFPKMSTS